MNRRMKQITIFMASLCVFFLATGCNSKVKEKPANEITDAQIEDIVRRSYQYVALYNVNNKFALSQGGWNTVVADTKLKDHTMKDIHGRTTIHCTSG